MISVENYNPEWPKWFAQLHAEIWPSVKTHALAFEHVGSTSVPGLAAKPIIDLDIVIESAEKLPAVIQALGSRGYMHLGNLGIEGREAFRAPKHPIKHNLYVCLDGCVALRNHLALRDHLRAVPAARDEYSALKKKLAAQFADSIDDYIEGKSAFILGILSKHALSKEELALIEQANRAPSK